MMMRLALFFSSLFCLGAFTVPGHDFFQKNQFYSNFEYGFVSFLQNNIQFGESGTNFDYVREANQKILFPNWRVEVGAKFLEKHRLELTYQPIFVSTKVVLKNNWQTDNILFAAGTPIEANYNFPFYRLSYIYDLIHGEKARFAIGGALQARNAAIIAASMDGKQLFETQSLGPVPLLLLVFDYKFSNSFYVNTKATGFWAPIRYLNGGSTDIEGWIYEGSTEMGLEITTWMDAYVTLRLLGGGNRGSSGRSRNSGGSFSENIINTLSFNVGFRLKTSQDSFKHET